MKSNFDINISENFNRHTMPKILDLLLVDRTKSTNKTNKNIIWGNDNYIHFGADKYSAHNQIKSELLTGYMKDLIVPRSMKNKQLKRDRTKKNAEVFTPTWVVKKQNDLIDQEYKNDNLLTYTQRTWLEVTCGEAPYMTTRYDMETGEPIILYERVGFLDRKLQRINLSISDKVEWHDLVVIAYKSSYGFEWNGDSLLLARENLIYTYQEYYIDKWKSLPPLIDLREIANIVSYNVFQMDGLTYTIPLSSIKEKHVETQLSLNLFGEEKQLDNIESAVTRPGKRVKIMDWEKEKMVYFDERIK
ncbi:restriction endonuclease [Staphylococcus equorum]|uniref:restriction endonuclease n=1 Tax=Staphylococcus equorum TaxID=246432 RepID=UPI00101CB607|nr:restriction endonuclease [Staphylococcus equorum]MDK9848058.1 restriction endonuclease [Staphylococcus equorum]MDK9852430.1 restriction endonuclease [Staphylococcus equorum]MDK9858037.1 restriction endonuclease [Staphylococcus equorum]MDK9875097.1 restriction endonuclease [Staphylococcus equorum]RYD12238.1 restriction endonuclease [Staphylococcus equorum]